MNVKLSPTMTRELIAKAERPSHRVPASTMGALMARGMVGLTPAERIAEDGTHYITSDGWAYLRQTHGIERPADEGRLSLADALSEAYNSASGTPVRSVPDVRAVDAGRLSLSEAVAVAYTPAGNPALPTFRVAETSVSAKPCVIEFIDRTYAGGWDAYASERCPGVGALASLLRPVNVRSTCDATRFGPVRNRRQ